MLFLARLIVSTLISLGSLIQIASRVSHYYAFNFADISINDGRYHIIFCPRRVEAEYIIVLWPVSIRHIIYTLITHAASSILEP